MALKIIDSYSESNQDSFHNFKFGGSWQTITGNGGTIDHIDLYLKKVGSPTGNLYIEIYAITGTHGIDGEPTGSPLATSDNLDVSALTSSYALTSVTFSGVNKITLNDGVHYAIYVKSPTSYGGSFTYIQMGTDGSSPTHDGNYGVDESGLIPISTVDLCFYVYAYGPSSSPLPTHFNL